MKTLINVIKLSQGLVIIALLVYPVMGASNLDYLYEAGRLTRADEVAYIYSVVWLIAFVLLFYKVGDKLICHFRASELKKERERKKELSKIAYDVRVYGFGCDVREMNN